MLKAAYNLQDFIDACKQSTKKVRVIQGAKRDAREILRLKTEKDIVDFIANYGLEKPTLVNSTAWKNNPNPENVIMVDSYSFYCGDLFGYIAFHHSESTGFWTIKSFKKNVHPDTRNKPFSDLKNLLGSEYD